MINGTNKFSQGDKSGNDPHPWKVKLYDDRRSNMTDVAYHLQNSLAASSSHAVQLALFAHQNGEVTIFEGTFFDCQEIADELRDFGLVVEIVG